MATTDKLTALQKKIERYNLLEAKERYEDNLSQFLQGAWSSIDSAHYQPTWVIDAICDHLEAVTLGHIPRLLINVPPRCSKTSVASICWPAWTWARSQESYWSGPKVKFLCGSYSGVLAMSSANTMRRLLMSPWYQKYWGSKFSLMDDQNTKMHFANTLGGARQSTSVGGSLLGLGGDIIVCLPKEERVLSTDGWLSIGEIVEKKLAVKVAGVSDSGEVGWQSIEKYEKNPGRPLIKISWLGGSLRCTEDHLVFVEGKGYIKAKEVAVGNCVWTAENTGLSGMRENLSHQTFAQPDSLQQGLLRSLAFTRDNSERIYSSLYYLRKRGLFLQGKKETSFKQAWALLRQTLLWSLRKRSQEPSLQRRVGVDCLQNLRKDFWCKATLQGSSKILFDGVSRYWAQETYPQETLHLRRLWKVFLDKVQIFCLACAAQGIYLLLSGVRRCCSFPSNERTRQWPLCSRQLWAAVPSGMVSRVQGADSAAGWKLLSGLQQAPFGGHGELSRSSHRLCQGESGSYELDNGMQGLSWEDARGFEGTSKVGKAIVYSVEKAGYVAETYNLRVSPYHNYFAEGILVHNCDDPHNTETEKVVETDADRNKVESWWKELSGTRLNSPKESAIVVVMQRLHERDLSGVILDSDDEDWVHLMVPMEHDILRHNVTVKLPQYDDDEPWEDPREEEGELMWPERFGEAEVARIKSRLGPYMSAGRLQQEPVPKGGGIIKRDWWLPWDSTTAQEYGLEWGPARKEFPHFELVCASIDTSYGRKEENDYNAMTVWGIWLDKAKNRRAMLMYAWAKRLPLRGRLVEVIPGEAKVNFEARQREAFGLIELVADTCKRYKVRRLLIENKTRGQDVADEIKRLFARENFGVELLDPVGDKVSRTHSVVPLFNDDAVWAPNTKWAEQVITQSASFPKADHDDLHDSVTQFLNWARENGLLTLAEESSALEAEDSRFQHHTRSVAEQYGV